jgi:DNA polymerase-3 subunit epsilon
MAKRPAPALDFTAIDFETANVYPNSACAVGLVQVRNGKIVTRATELIRPPFRRFDFTDIHGIAWNDVAGVPTFDRVWRNLRPLFRGSTFLAAHHAPFDRGVLEACCDWYDVRPPDLPFECTVQMARRRWNIYPTKLPDVARYLGLALKHHDAGSDANVCAQIVIAAANDGPREVGSRRPGSRTT